jgi:AraC-like DNA-binding protein
LTDGAKHPRSLPKPAFDLIRARILRGFPALVRKLGGDPDALLAAVGVDPRRCEDSNAITCRQWIAVLDHAARVLDAPSFGMLLAEQQGGLGVYGPLGATMRNAGSFGEALRYVAAHNGAHSLAARVWIEPAADGGEVFVGHDILVGAVPERRQAMEHALLSGHLGARELTGGRAGARRIHFRHRAQSSAAVYRRKFGCDVRFCQNEDGAAFGAKAMASPVLEADSAAFHQLAERIRRDYGAQRPPLHAQVRGAVMQRLRTSDCRSEDISTALAMHPRTLLRRLREEGTSFQRIKDEVRHDLMLYYLSETDLDLSRISEKLGFAEQSVMSRFARTWLGASPSELRARSLSPAA